MSYPSYVRAVVAAALALASLAASPALAHAEPRDPWVRSWGLNIGSQLGNGTTLDQTTPGSVVGVARGDVRELSAGGFNSNLSFALALLDDGTVLSWGGNTSGQLGDGTTTQRGFPATVAGLSGVSSIAAAGGPFALAVRGGRVLAWGTNAYGQLGNGLTTPDTAGLATRPVAVQSLNKVKDVSGGCEHSVALREDGTVWTWGRGHLGQLGNGAYSDRNTPQKVPGLDDVVAISAGCAHSLALTAEGTVKAWGRNNKGQLGNDSAEDSPAPVDVRHLDGATKIITGAYQSYAVLDDGTVRAWGWNGLGQLGDGTTVDRATPVPLPGLSDVQEMAGGWQHTLAALSDQSVLAWGNNSNGQLGNGTTDSSPTPVTALPAGSGVTRVAASVANKSSYAY
ncbi:chromosome condensation regulator RCC1 [Streptomyces sp. NBC_00250]|uniref:RCC1 domain-containing protein n=1 Tax=Streptomyces sp. NBC_00250 TaxID=2903641 RepID=UPI002E29D3CF|nr:chromosome condensation regulator RCC1 [Streptomyces sp. NBC_00250]